MMKVGTKEHYELMEQFERDYPYLRLDRENGSSWKSGQIYQSGETNNYFKMYIGCLVIDSLILIVLVSAPCWVRPNSLTFSTVVIIFLRLVVDSKCDGNKEL
jgi:hypothetical protein